MSGGSKKQTVGYWYSMGLHMGLCHGPVDAVLQLRAGDRAFWSGEVTDNATVQINAPQLFGGEEKEGGIKGTLDIEFGGDSQTQNSYLASKVGTGRPAYRGILGLVYRGFIAANNPYIKPWSAKVRRILQGWKGGSAWYPEKAEVSLLDGTVTMLGSGWEYQIENFDEPNTVWNNFTIPTDGWAQGGELPFSTNGMDGGPYWTPTRSNIWLRRKIYVHSPGLTLNVAADNGCAIWINGNYIGSNNPTNTPISGNDANPVSYELDGRGLLEVVVKAYAEINQANEAGNIVTMSFTGSPLRGMNPAHIVYQGITDDRWGMGYDSSILDLDSFEAAADTFHAEGMGLCIQWARQDSIQSFLQVVLDHAGAVLVEDRRTLKLKLIPIRGDYNVESLPHFGDEQGNVLDVERLERATVTETVNELTVSYTDAVTGKTGSVTVQNLAAIQAAGRVIPESRDYPGIPTAELALRVAMRDLRAATSGLARVRLTVNREGYDLVPGNVIRFSWSEDGIVEMPLRILDIDYGSLTDGRVRLECVEDVFGLPETTYAQPEPPGWVPPDTTPRPSPAAEAFEAPYRELLQVLGRSETEALPDDAGYVAVAAAPPTSVSPNYALYTRTGSADYEEASLGDWCPTGTLQEAIGPLDTEIILASTTLLEQVEVGTIALLGTGRDAEIVRVDAVDSATGELTLGRGCLDTVAKAWPAGTRFWAIDEYATGSGTQYVDGETVDAKVLTRTGEGLLDVDDAPAVSVTLDQRQARPYPPGKFRINTEAYPSEVVGPVTITWAHRDRLLQDDQVIDEGEASIGPEPGTTYQLDCYLNGFLDDSQTEITGESAVWEPSGGGLARVELWAVRDSLASWQKHVHQFTLSGSVPWTPANLAAPPQVWINDESDYTEDSGAISVLNNNLGSLSSATYTQATSGKRPAWIEDALNGRAVIDWNGGQIMFTSDTGVLDLFRNVTQATVVGVYKLETAADALRSMLWWSRGTSTASRVALTASDSSVSGASPGMPIVGGRRLDGDNFDGAIATAAHVDEWVMVVGTLDFSARIARIYINGVLDNEDTNEWSGSGATSNTRSQQASIGANSSESSYFIGQTAELLAMNVNPSSDEIDQLFGYLAHRWGLADLLPSEHPYKHAPPVVPLPTVESLWIGAQS